MLEAEARQDAGFAKIPAFCRVAGDIHPAADSDIKFEVWMPLNNWNGSFEAVGNGGLAGTPSYPAMGQAVASGFATGSTDTGHGPDPDGNAMWAVGHPEKVIDFGYRAVHEMTVKSKAAVKAFYGADPKYSYWNGCSEGGRQGMGEGRSVIPQISTVSSTAHPVFQFHAWPIALVYGTSLVVLKDPSQSTFRLRNIS